MADQKQDNGPFHLYGRRTEHEQEIRVGMTNDLDEARQECNDMVDTGVWAHATVRDRNDQTVHVGEPATDGGHGPDGNGLPPAA